MNEGVNGIVSSDNAVVLVLAT